MTSTHTVTLNSRISISTGGHTPISHTPTGCLRQAPVSQAATTTIPPVPFGSHLLRWWRRWLWQRWRWRCLLKLPSTAAAKSSRSVCQLWRRWSLFLGNFSALGFRTWAPRETCYIIILFTLEEGDLQNLFTVVIFPFYSSWLLLLSFSGSHDVCTCSVLSTPFSATTC